MFEYKTLRECACEELTKEVAKLGTGARFKALKNKLAGQKGVTNPGALAADIGREKYGSKKMGKLSAKGRKSKESNAETTFAKMTQRGPGFPTAKALKKAKKTKRFVKSY